VGQGILGAKTCLRIKEGLRSFQIKQGFLEVEAPLTKGQVTIQSQADISVQYTGGCGLGCQTKDQQYSREGGNKFWAHVQFIDIVFFINDVK